MDAHLMLALAEGFGPALVPGLLAPDTDPRAILLDPPSGLPPAVLRRLRAGDLAERARRLRVESSRLGMFVLTPDDDAYPGRLRAVPLRPLVLFARGDLEAAAPEHRALAVVGSRTPTPYGLAAAQDFATTAARAGIVLWSGLAFGIDATVHQAAIDCETPTVAVLAGGLDEVQPPGHTALAERILASGGLLLSEAPPGLRPQRGHFPRRNRIIACGAEAVLVVEAGERSGAMHTAHHGADAGIPVFAVPGPYTSPRSRGCHVLLSEGAGIALDPPSLLRALCVEGNLRDPRMESGLDQDADQAAILAALALGPRPGDLVMRETGLAADRFVAALMELLERDRIVRLDGDLYAVSGREPRAIRAGTRPRATTSTERSRPSTPPA